MSQSIPATAFLENKVRQRGLSWQEICETIVELHRRYVEDGTSTTLEQTALKLGFHDGSAVAKYHKVYEYWELTEVRHARTIAAALKAVKDHLAPKQKSAEKIWLGRANYGTSPEVTLKRKLNKIFKKAPHANH